MTLNTTVHGGVGEGVGVAVLLARDVGEGDGTKSGGDLCKARLLFLQDRIPHFIFLVHLLHDELAVELHDDPRSLALHRGDELSERLEGEDDRLIFGEVIGLVAAELGDASYRSPELVSDYRARARGPRGPSRPAIGVDGESHMGTIHRSLTDKGKIQTSSAITTLDLIFRLCIIEQG